MFIRLAIISATYSRLPNNQTDITRSMRFVNRNEFPIGHLRRRSKPPEKKTSLPSNFQALQISSISRHTVRLPSAGVSNQVHETALLLLRRGIHFMDRGAGADLANLPINALVTMSRRNKELSTHAFCCGCIILVYGGTPTPLIICPGLGVLTSSASPAGLSASLGA